MNEIKEISRNISDKRAQLIAVTKWIKDFSGFEERASVRPMPDIHELISFAKRLDRVTNREFEVFEKVMEGMTAVQIGEKLDISPRTVDVHKARFIQKMEVGNMVVAARHYAVLETLTHVDHAALQAAHREKLAG